MAGKMEIGSHNSPSADDAHLSPSDHQSHSKKRGGWKAIKYILGNESLEKLASMSLGQNLTVYLRTNYNLSGIILVNVVSLWAGTTNISTIGGAIISDAYLGRFLTLLFGTIFTLLGMAAMTLTASLSELRPHACKEDSSVCSQPHKWQLAFLFSALGLITMGAGGIRPCNIAFGADQFDTNTEKGQAQLESFFNWWYFSFTIALSIAQTGVIYVQTDISWAIGFAIPTACLVVSITIFLIGQNTYIYRQPQGTVFVDMARVAMAAYRKRKINLKSGNELCYYDPTEEVDQLEDRKPIRINRFKYLDKAAVITNPNELDPRGFPVNKWRLCSVQQVEKLKRLLKLMPVWVAGIPCFLVIDQQITFGYLQAMQMNSSIHGNFKIPPAWMGVTSMLTLSMWILLYEKLYIPKARKILKRDSRLTMQQRIFIGIILSILCMVVAGIVESKRRSLALKEGSFASPLHVAALLPQFILSGLTEAFAAVGLMEFFTIQLPESMRSVSGSIFFLSISIANYLNSLIVNIIHYATGRRGEEPWLGGHNLNVNKLDYYYYIIAGLGVIDLMFFIFIARKYVSFGEEDKEGGEVQMTTSQA